MNKEIIDQLKEAKDTEELKAVAAEKGYPLNEEEAKRYFDLLHTSGKIADDELANVTGGACSKSRNGSLYSSDPPHNLITTIGNACNSYVVNPGVGFARNCGSCKNSYFGGPTAMTMYCSVRKYDDDEYNPAK